MRMYEKLKTLKDKLQKMKTNRANRQIGQTFHFSPFSRKQKQVLTWWCKESPVHDMDGVIADGAIRSGKTISMACISGRYACGRLDFCGGVENEKRRIFKAL